MERTKWSEENEWNEVDVNEVKRSDGISEMNEVNGTEWIEWNEVNGTK